MGKCFRHFKALMRKNFILWYRTPLCSAFEIIIPVLLMCGLNWIRVKVPTTSVDQAGMLKKNGFAGLGVTPTDDLGVWHNNTDTNSIIDLPTRPFACFGNYSYSDVFAATAPTNAQLNDENDENGLLGGTITCENYDLGTDLKGPQFYFGTQCLKTFSWSRPRQASPIIGIIGTQSDITDSIGRYFESLSRYQRATAARLAVPQYRPMDFDTIESFNEYIQAADYSTSDRQGVCLAVQVENPEENDWQVGIHFSDHKIGVSKFSNAQGIPSQANPVWEPQIAAPNLNSYIRYQHNGFAFVQNLIAQQLLAYGSGNPQAFIQFMFQPMQTETSVFDPFGTALGLLLPLFLLITYIPPVYNMTFKIVREKESRAKETMRIMGMTDLPYWLSWFAYYTCINTIVTTLAWFVLLFNVCVYSQPMYLWLMFWLYGQAVFGQIIFLQSMFSSSKYAGIVSTVIYFCGVLVNSVVIKDGVPRSSKLLASILPQVAIMQGSVQFATYESTGVGLNASTASVQYEGFSFNSALGMLIFDFFLFFLLGLYLDKVVPSDFGQRLNPCFLFMPSYWCGNGRRQNNQNQGTDEQQNLLDIDDNTFETNQMPIENYEAAPLMSKRLEATGDYLKVENLQKTFSGGFRAVAGINVKMYDNQIFALLGHNGAGKSTVISMLTGLIKKSQGTASCYNTDMFEEMEDVREFMGVCPQHDVLFDLLNAREHLDIFYDFKGGDPARKSAEIDSLIHDAGLTIDQRKLSHTLSGGNKRKLSVCIALCGNSRLILLDEPTAGMDLGARRNLWDMLKSYKKDRIIILTTHYMDEADVLGDRIGIMCKGTMQCLGSSLFLKNRFGLGYQLTFVKKRRRVHPKLEKFIMSYFQGVQKKNESTDDISYVVPKAESANFGGFFEALDQRLEEFDILSYGVSMSNLEDVFLKINQEFAPDLFGDLKKFQPGKNTSGVDESNVKAIGHSTMEISKQENSEASIDASIEDIMDFEGENLIRGSSCVRSCTASSAKRYIIYKRDWCGLLCQVVIPLILVLFGLWLTSGPSKLVQSPPRNLSTGFYPPKQRILMSTSPYVAADAGDVTGAQLYEMLPNSTDAFEVEYVPSNTNYTEFYDLVYEARKQGDPFPYRFGSYNIFRANKDEQFYQIVNYLNITSQDVTAMYPQYMYTAILRVGLDLPDLNFNVTSVAYPVYQQFKDIEEAAGAYDFVFMTAIALALIPCVMVQFILNERMYELKHQQLISGMSLPGYWASNIIFDIFMAYIPILLIILLVIVFNKTYDGIWVLFLLFPPAIVPFTYVTSFLFTSDINAQISTLLMHFVAGGLLSIIVFILQIVPKLMHIGDALRWVCCIIPTFCVTHGILFASSGSLLVSSRISDDDGTSSGQQSTVIIPRTIPPETWAWYNLKGDAYFLVLHFFLGLISLTLIELEVYSYFDWCPKIGFKRQDDRNTPKLIKDDDVLAEEQRVALQGANPQQEHRGSMLMSSDSSGGPRKDPNHIECIRVHNFQKEYDTFCGAPIKAVKKASFALDYGECFGLLGVNGAGKSTTFKSLTREIIPTTGKITVQGFDINEDFEDARKLIGYCPQKDAIFPRLTVEETLKFYALIKGIRTNKIKPVIEKAIKDLNLKDHRHKFAGTLSGGNKRKLSVGMALIGNPPIILLDEPSAGMDPEARRFMWQVVEKISQRDKKSAVILTTHSMEEAEALATKLGIMVRGGIFRCMGSAQHVKNKYGIGYEVEIKVKKVVYSDLQEMSQQLGFNADIQSKVSLKGAIEQCQGAQYDQVLEQIRSDGLGHDLANEAEIDSSSEVRLRNFLEFLKQMSFGFRILTYLTRSFDKVEVLEQCGDFFKLRVPKEDKTIGWLFGNIETEKRNLGIEEYSVQQTTLEQIFQTFANQAIASDKAAFTFRGRGEGIYLMNPDHKMTEEQERLSQRGLSFHEDDDRQSFNQPPKLDASGRSSSSRDSITQNQPAKNERGPLIMPENDDDDEVGQNEEM